MCLTILIPAAGSASRMRGGDKLLELVGGEPVLRRQARQAREVCARVIVTLRSEDAARRKALEGLDITLLSVPDAAEGMAASLRIGAAAAAAGSVMILPGDMPEFEAADLRKLIEAADHDPAAILRGASGDLPGHPVLIPADLRGEMLTLQGDTGARRILQAHHHRVRLIALPGQRALTDLDTPEDWANWRALSGQ